MDSAFGVRPFGVDLLYLISKRNTFILLTKYEGRTGTISAKGLDIADRT